MASLPGSPFRDSPLNAFAFNPGAYSDFTTVTPGSQTFGKPIAVRSLEQTSPNSHRHRDICTVTATIFAVISAIASSTAVIVGLIMAKSGSPDLGEDVMVIAAPICIITDLICAYFVMKCLLYKRNSTPHITE